VNDRNRKLRSKRKLAKKKQRSIDTSSRSEGDSCGSSLLVTPRSSSSGSAIGGSIESNKSTTRESASHTPGMPPALGIPKKWDSYCRHISCHKLSAEEELARNQNKNKYLAHMRSEASKRPDRNGLKKKERETQQKDAESSVRPRKPPVPRLSRLARSRKNKENQQNGQRPLSRKTTKGSCTSKEIALNEIGQTSVDNIPAKVPYLDFISKKIDETPNCSLTSSVSIGAVASPSLPNRSNSTDENESSTRSDSDEEDDDSKFRSQIERIVQRAANMVLEEQHRTQKSPNSFDSAISISGERNGTGSICTYDNRQNSIWEQGSEHIAKTSDTTHRQVIFQGQKKPVSPIYKSFNDNESNFGGQEKFESNSEKLDSSHREDIFQRKNELAVLEEKIRSMSSSVMNENDECSSSSSQRSGHTKRMNDSLRGSVDNTFSIGTSSLTEVVPRQPVRQQDFGYKSIHDLLHSLDSNSCTTSVHTSEISSPLETSDVISNLCYDTDVSRTADMPRFEDGSEVIPRIQSHLNETPTRQPNLTACLEETSLPLPVHPIVEPSRNMQLEEGPLPWGYGHISQLSQKNEKDDQTLHSMIMQGVCTQNEKSGSLVDGMFSLFG